MADYESKQTHDHAVVRAWCEARGGRPAKVASPGGPGGVLRISFDPNDETLIWISWDEFFRIFEERNLDFVYQEQLRDGSESRFFKFVKRE